MLQPTGDAMATGEAIITAELMAMTTGAAIITAELMATANNT